MAELVEHPRFDAVRRHRRRPRGGLPARRRARDRGAYAPARAYLRRLVARAEAWDGPATYARRAVRRLVDIGAREPTSAKTAMADLAGVPPTAPDETRGDIAYITGRARRRRGRPRRRHGRLRLGDARARPLLGAGDVPARPHPVEHGKLQGGRGPLLQGRRPQAPRPDDAPSLPTRASSPCATSRALGARPGRARAGPQRRRPLLLLPRPPGLRPPRRGALRSRDHPLREEGLPGRPRAARRAGERWPCTTGTRTRRGSSARTIDLAQCKFPDADKKLIEFLARYEPVRDAARRIAETSRRRSALLAAVRTRHRRRRAPRSAARAAEVDARDRRARPASTRRTARVAAPPRGARARGERPRLAIGALGDMQRSWRPTAACAPPSSSRRATPRGASAARARARRRAACSSPSSRPPARPPTRSPRIRAAARRARRAPRAGQAGVRGDARGVATGAPTFPTSCAPTRPTAPSSRCASTRSAPPSPREETRLAKDALHRLDLRLSRLLRRARLGRIECVLGRKRALEVEIEAINDGVLPADAVDSLDAARYLQDNEEYWPFEGDDWPDEFVGSEVPK